MWWDPSLHSGGELKMAQTIVRESSEFIKNDVGQIGFKVGFVVQARPVD